MSGTNPRHFLNALNVLLGVPMTWSFLVGLYGFKEYDPLYLAAQTVHSGDLVFWGCLAVSFGLFAADLWLEKYTGDYKDELYGLLKDIGEKVKNGLAVEAAVKKSAGWKSTPPANALSEALELAEEVPFDAALKKVAEDSGQPSFREVAGLMATAVSTGGDVGANLRWLGGHFSTLRQNEKEFAAKIDASLRLLRGVALLAAPFMYWQLQSAFDRFNKNAASIDPFTLAFFVYGVVGMAMLDGLVYGRWVRVPSKLPLYLGVVRFSLGLW